MASNFSSRPRRVLYRESIDMQVPDLTSATCPSSQSDDDDDDAASIYGSIPEDTPERTIPFGLDTPPPPAPHTLLVNDPFSTDSSKILFESIDQLRKSGASQDLDLPQLVIVGKQSAGKSSLLQSLTDIPFPVGGRLCTRFATRIVARRSSPDEPDVVRATIEPADVDQFNYRGGDPSTDSFSRTIDSMSAEAFEAVVREVTEILGINSTDASERRNFSSKVLKIEMAGPRRSHFGILDVPGVFSATIGGVTDEEMRGVTQMVESYMKKPENIVILVADAVDDLSCQAIFKMAEHLNVDSSRIVAVFTKCDRAEHPENVVQIVKEGDGIAGKHLRWYVVRNRDPKASSSFNREEAEVSLFNSDPWLEIPEEQRGTTNLKSYLGHLLCRRIREGFPALQASVEDKLREQEIRLKSLGEPRGSHAQQKAYLWDIVQKYEDLARKALRSPAELPFNEIKLRGRAQSKNAEFAKMMLREGHRYQFIDIGQEVQSFSPEDLNIYSDSRSNVLTPDLLTPATTPQRRNRVTPVPSLFGQYPQRTDSCVRPISPLYNEISAQISANRGEELPGMLNPSVLKPLWVEQTRKWLDLSEKHLKDLVRITVDIAIKIFAEATKHIGMPTRTQNKLEKVISDFGDSAKERVLRQLHNLYRDNSTLALQTNNPQFEKNVNIARSKRFRGALKRYRVANPSSMFINQLGIIQATSSAFGSSENSHTHNLQKSETWTIVTDDFIPKLFDEIHPHGQRAQNVQDEIHDLLKAYYDIALQNFLHDIEFSIVEPFLQSTEGPLLGLSIDYILRLSEAEVEEFGGEDTIIVEQRRDALFKIEKLGRAMEIAGDAWRRTREVERIGG